MSAPRPPYQPTPRRLVRPEDDRMVAGVCSGLALYFGVDKALVRVLAVVLAVVLFPAVPLGYLVLALIVPEGRRAVPSPPSGG